MARGLCSGYAEHATTSTATTATGACVAASTASLDYVQQAASSSCGPAAPIAAAAPLLVQSPTQQQRPAAEVLAPLLRGRPFIVAKVCAMPANNHDDGCVSRICKHGAWGRERNTSELEEQAALGLQPLSSVLQDRLPCSYIAQ